MPEKSYSLKGHNLACWTGIYKLYWQLISLTSEMKCPIRDQNHNKSSSREIEIINCNYSLAPPIVE